MEDHKRRLIQFLLETGALKFDDFALKSGRNSPWFVNLGDFNDGTSISVLGEVYAEALLNSGTEFDTLYGIPEKGIALAISTSMAIAKQKPGLPWFFTRKFPKGHGEATKLSPEEKIKALVVGKAPKTGDRIAQLDDVFTAGDAKYEARELLESLGDFKYPVLAIAVDRQEVGIDGKSAIKKYEAKTGTKVVSVVNAAEVYQFLKEQIVPTKGIDRMANYLRVYGTDEARKFFGKLEQTVLEKEKGIIPACDVETIEQFEELVRQTADVEGISAYKIGFQLALRYGLPKVVETAKKHTDKELIYDHQKAATDIPDTGKGFARVLKSSGINTAIIFPQSGPETERAWIYHAVDNGLKIIVGGRMTHPAYSVSEGGFITDEGALEMYRIAARIGIKDFVVPGNKPEAIKQIREIVETEGVSKAVFYAPGLIAQSGKISDAGKAAGERFHGIVGRGIYTAANMKDAAIEHTSQLSESQ